MTEKKKHKLPFVIATTKGDVLPFPVLNRYAMKQSEDGSKQIKRDPFADSYGTQGLVIPPYDQQALTQLPEMNVFHQRCINAKVVDVTGNGWTLIKNEGEVKDADSASDPNYQRLDAFFDGQWPPFEQALERFNADYESTGNAYFEMTRVGGEASGEPKHLLHIPSYTMRVHKSMKKYAQRRGNKTRWFKAVGYEMDVDCNTGQEYSLGTLSPLKRATEVIHMRQYSSRSDFYGIPEFMGAVGAIDGHVAQRDYNIKFFENFGIPSYAVYITGDYELGDPDEESGEYPIIKAIKDRLSEIPANPHVPLVFAIPGAEADSRIEVKFERLAAEVKESSFRLYRIDNRDEVIVAHGVPPYRAGVYLTGSLGGNLAEESTKIYMQSTVYPRQEKFAVTITKYVVQMGFGIENWTFKLLRPDTGTRSDDVDEAIKLFDKAALTPNDLIRAFGDKYGIQPSDDPAMDWHYLGGKPIDADELATPASPVELEVVKDFYDSLVEIAKKQNAA
jgi:PBSX family phage portal protein